MESAGTSDIIKSCTVLVVLLSLPPSSNCPSTSSCPSSHSEAISISLVSSADSWIQHQQHSRHLASPNPATPRTPCFTLVWPEMKGVTGDTLQTHDQILELNMTCLMSTCFCIHHTQTVSKHSHSPTALMFLHIHVRSSCPLFNLSTLPVSWCSCTSYCPIETLAYSFYTPHGIHQWALHGQPSNCTNLWLNMAHCTVHLYSPC